MSFFRSNKRLRKTNILIIFGDDIGESDISAATAIRNSMERGSLPESRGGGRAKLEAVSADRDQHARPLHATEG
jgi:hypothetical protein